MIKCWHKTALTLFAFVLIELVVFVHIRNNENYRQLLAYDVSAAISQYEKGAAPAVDLSKITAFPWDRLYIAGPYTSPTEIDKMLGTLWVGSRLTAIESNDRITLLIFTKRGQVVRYLEYPRYLGDFDGAVRVGGYGHEEARFVLGADRQMMWAGP